MSTRSTTARRRRAPQTHAERAIRDTRARLRRQVQAHRDVSRLLRELERAIARTDELRRQALKLELEALGLTVVRLGEAEAWESRNLELAAELDELRARFGLPTRRAADGAPATC